MTVADDLRALVHAELTAAMTKGSAQIAAAIRRLARDLTEQYAMAGGGADPEARGYIRGVAEGLEMAAQLANAFSTATERHDGD